MATRGEHLTTASHQRATGSPASEPRSRPVRLPGNSIQTPEFPYLSRLSFGFVSSRFLPERNEAKFWSTKRGPVLTDPNLDAALARVDFS